MEMMERTETHPKIATQKPTTNEEVISISSTEEINNGKVVEEMTLSSGSNEGSTEDMDIESETKHHKMMTRMTKKLRIMKERS